MEKVERIRTERDTRLHRRKADNMLRTSKKSRIVRWIATVTDSIDPEEMESTRRNGDETTGSYRMREER